MQRWAAAATGAWDTAVELNQVVKRFVQRQRTAGSSLRELFHTELKSVTALDQVSFAIRRGEFVAYAGPNGAGKSTTFKLLCGMLAPESGRVRTLGYDPMRQRIPLMERCGVLFGNRSELWWDHPVISSFEWKRTVWDIPDQVYREMLDLVTELLDLKGILKTFARELSLGQRMRADLGLMLLHQPELVLLDEPTLGLDVLAKRQMIEFLKRINREKGVTILVTSHDMDDLTAMARRILLISQGRIAFDGTPQALQAAAGDKRTLLVTRPGEAPELPGAVHVSSEQGRHQYEFDASQIPVAQLLGPVSRIPGVLDVETGRAPIEAVIARLYDDWKRTPNAN